MPNCKRGVGQGQRSPVDGGKLNQISIPLPRGGARAAQEEPSRMAAAAAKAVAAGGGSGGTRDEALRCPERPGAVPEIGRRDGGVASQRVGHPLSPPQIGLHNGAAHGDHGGVG